MTEKCLKCINFTFLDMVTMATDYTKQTLLVQNCRTMYDVDQDTLLICFSVQTFEIMKVKHVPCKMQMLPW